MQVRQSLSAKWVQRSQQFSSSNHYFANKTTINPLSLFFTALASTRLTWRREKREGSESKRQLSLALLVTARVPVAPREIARAHCSPWKPSSEAGRQAQGFWRRVLGKGTGKRGAGSGGGPMGHRGGARGLGAGPRAGSDRVSPLRAPRLPQRTSGGTGRGGTSRAGRELAPLARVGDGRGGGGVSVRAAWGRGGEAAATAAAASELRHTGPGRREPESSAGSWWRRRR